MIELALKDIQKAYGVNIVLNNITFEINNGERVGVVGRNGTGKTTIFKIISGLESFDKGTLNIRREAAVGYLDQIPNYPEEYTVNRVLHNVFENVYKISEEIKMLEKQMSIGHESELNSLMKKYGRLQSLFEHLEGYRIEEKVNRICIGLKITQLKERLFNTLSGGEKTTVVLAKILLQNPDILLLDEPSNHLDMDSIEWLEEFLKDYKGTVLIISHDRYFLDKVVTKIIEIEDGDCSIYNGNYSYYVEEKDKRLMQEFDLYEDQQKKIKAIEKKIKDLKDWGNRSDNPKFHKRAASMQKRLDKMDKLDKPSLERQKIKLKFNNNERSGKEVIKIKNLSKAFDNKSILYNCDFYMKYKERVAVLGKNGSGKSTLIKIILRQYAPDAGETIIGSNVKIGYLAQDIKFDNEDKTVIELFRETYEYNEEIARGIMAKFLFYGEEVFKKIKNLSGGEKSRLKLCQLMYSDINLLILDEPTNHLDIDSREMLEEALKEFNGTVLFISHDRYFINKLAERIVEIDNKSLIDYPGNYNYYRQKKDEINRRASEINFSNAVKKEKTIKENFKNNEIKKKENYLRKLEEKIHTLEEKMKDYDLKMEQIKSNHQELSILFNEKNDIEKEVEKLMEEWVRLNG